MEISAFPDGNSKFESGSTVPTSKVIFYTKIFWGFWQRLDTIKM
jgi:hypothetical protein